MDEKINFLINSGYFSTLEVDEKGYGTFMVKIEPKKTSNRFLEQARFLKRDADTLNKTNAPNRSQKAMILYIQSVFYYIKGYKFADSKSNCITHWRGLCKYIKELERMTTEPEIKEFIKSSLFAVRFHLLSLEVGSLQEQDQVAAFSREFQSLHHSFNTIQKVKRLEELEEAFTTLKNKFN